MVDPRPLERLAGGLFVGREAALAHIEGAAAQALAGRPAWVLLTGEAGIGKTRTAEEAAAQARRRGFAVHTGRCPEAEGAPPFRPWLQILRSIVRALPPPQRERLHALIAPSAAELAALVPELAGGEPRAALEAGGAEARFRLFEAVAALLAAVAHRSPFVLVFDDVHRADEASLALLAFCAREVAEAQLLVLATRRDEPAARGGSLEAGSAGAQRAALGRPFQEIPLAGLDADEIRTFFRALLEREPASAFVAAVRERTEGSPLFLTELARLLALEGKLDAADPAAALAAALPSGLREALRQRLAALSPPCRRALAQASALGREFARDVLARILDPDLAAAAGPLLDEALAVRVIGAQPTTADAFRFSHVLIRELLYDGLSLDERARLHARAGRALEALHPIDPTPVLGELAHHFGAAIAEAGPERAAHWSIEAGREALRRLAFDDARAALSAALDLLARIEPAGAGAARERDRRACAVRIDLARADERAGAAEESRARYLEAVESARRLGDGELLARAVLGFAGERTGTPTHAPDPERVALLEEALAQSPRERAELRVPLLSRLAIELHWSPDPARRDALAREAVALARESREPTLHAQALLGAIWATWGPDNAEWRRDAASEAIAREADVRDLGSILSARVARAAASLELGDLAAFDEDAEAIGRAAAELHLGLMEIFALALRAMRAILEGRFAEAERLDARTLELARRVDSPHTAGVHASHLAAIRSEQGRAGEIEPAFAAFAERARHPIARVTLAWLRAQCGKHAEARRDLRKLLARGLDDLPRDFFWLGCVALLGEVAAALQERRAARILYQALLPYAERFVVVGMSAGCLGSASRILGLLATALGRYEQAELHFEAALEANARLRALPFLAHTQEDFAALFRVRGRSGDLERAEKLEDEATALRAELAVTDAAERAAAAAAETAAPAEAPAAAPSPAEGVLLGGREHWTVRFGSAEARVRDALGMRYLALLLERPEQELHVLDLVARGGREEGSGAERAAEAAPVVDARARAEYRARLEALREELDEAERTGDAGRAGRARAELEEIEAELARAFGLGGRARRLGDPVERARKAVYNRLRSAMAQLEADLPALGRHLARSVRTGTFCAYRPERPIAWRVER